MLHDGSDRGLEVNRPRADCAAYIADLVAELAAMARRSRLADLARQLEKAAAEARRAHASMTGASEHGS